MDAFPEPTLARADRTEVLLGYLDYFRARVLDKVTQLPAAEHATTRVPSGWTPAQMIKHLTFVEHRWLEWGFEGQAVPDPWGDQRDGRWFVPESQSVDDLASGLAAQGERTRAVVRAHDLDDRGAPGPRWDGQPPATLERVLLHLVQEYARHLGHIDIVTELAASTSLGE
jgi:uncharacterized damage-inducible protein DinB